MPRRHKRNSTNERATPAFCVFMDGTPAWYDSDTILPVTHATERDAQLEIVEDLEERLQLFRQGDFSFEEALTIDDYVVPVMVAPDGTLSDASGYTYGKRKT